MENNEKLETQKSATIKKINKKEVSKEKSDELVDSIMEKILKIK